MPNFDAYSAAAVTPGGAAAGLGNLFDSLAAGNLKRRELELGADEKQKDRDALMQRAKLKEGTTGKKAIGPAEAFKTAEGMVLQKFSGSAKGRMSKAGDDIISPSHMLADPTLSPKHASLVGAVAAHVQSGDMAGAQALIDQSAEDEVPTVDKMVRSLQGMPRGWTPPAGTDNSVPVTEDQDIARRALPSPRQSAAVAAGVPQQGASPFAATAPQQPVVQPASVAQQPAQQPAVQPVPTTTPQPGRSVSRAALKQVALKNNKTDAETEARYKAAGFTITDP